MDAAPVEGPPVVGTQPSGKPDLDHSLRVLAFTGAILDKKYELYGWCEAKIATLVTLNSITSAAAFIVVGSIFPTHSVVDKLLAGTTLIAILASLAIALRHIEPKMRSGRTDWRNLRSVVGTEAFASDEAYYSALSMLSIEDMAKINAKQAYGMNHNIWRNQRAIRFAAGLSAIGLLSFVILLVRVYLWT